MTSVINSVINRIAAGYGKTAYQVVTAREQYSSITAPGDRQLGLYPAVSDPQWLEAQVLAGQALQGTLRDITMGSTNYYALGMEEPEWATGMTPTVIISGQQFLRP